MRLVWHAIRGRPRLMASLLLGIVVAFALPASMPGMARGLVAWDVAGLVYLALSSYVFTVTPTTRMADLSEAQETGEWTVFWFTVVGVFASFVAIIGEFSVSKDESTGVRGLHVALVATTLLVSWLTTHTIFALRYAHEYYDRMPTTGELDRGLEFPGGLDPDYWDFFYFSIVLGMTFQVSDVQIASRKLRRLAIVHGVLSFLFNTVIIALTVNIGASLL